MRDYLSAKDTGQLLINNTLIKLKEDWKIHVDHGVCSEQFLVSLNDVSPGVKLYIGNSVIKEITKNSILISSEIELRHGKKVIEKKLLDIRIDRNLLSGFLYERN